MKDSTRNAAALFVLGLSMVSISPFFSNFINYDELFSFVPFFSDSFSVQSFRWGSVGIGFMAILFGVVVVLYNWKVNRL